MKKISLAYVEARLLGHLGCSETVTVLAKLGFAANCSLEDILCVAD